jgi:hypothetical protein
VADGEAGRETRSSAAPAGPPRPPILR